ncbi:hypothetical protein E2C01_079023 [Portunus trituberculatus]|uniref:Uncharacterized protein n=1 Tax=Portunus trituberculatus TaxID=210409 RepID=A0A5B7IRR9_PORTR|nr:hypothetical protein [Portunus trituberculatus]
MLCLTRLNSSPSFPPSSGHPFPTYASLPFTRNLTSLSSPSGTKKHLRVKLTWVGKNIKCPHACYGCQVCYGSQLYHKSQYCTCIIGSRRGAVGACIMDDDAMDSR